MPTIRRVIVEAYGPPHVLVSQEVQRPRPKSGEVLIAVAAIGVNFADVQRRRGPYAGAPAPPFLPGLEVAGIIIEKGAGVHLEIGQRVAALPQSGAYAEAVVAPARATFPLPDAVDMETGAAALIAGITACQLLRSVGRIAKGERAVVLSAAGGVGHVLVQLARLYGAGMVIGAVGSHAKAEIALDAGADAAVVYPLEPLGSRVRELTSGEGANLVLDSVGTATLMDSLESVAPFGRLVVFGQSSGSLPPLPLGRVLSDNVSILGYSGGPYRLRHQVSTRRAGHHVLRLISEGELNIRLGLRLPLGEAVEAHRRLEAADVAGKVLLIP